MNRTSFYDNLIYFSFCTSVIVCLLAGARLWQAKLEKSWLRFLFDFDLLHRSRDFLLAFFLLFGETPWTDETRRDSCAMLRWMIQ